MPPDAFEYSTTLSYMPILAPLVPPAPEEKVLILLLLYFPDAAPLLPLVPLYPPI